ncbi:MAG: hypothetical protein H0U31_02930 [Chloroflexia bacterium]|nr:hypothetical protein [Chloroflexia bacterium]
MRELHDEHNFEQRIWDVARGVEDAAVLRHVATCAHCQDHLFALRQLVRFQATTGGALVEPPELVTFEASRLMTRIRPDLVAQPPTLSDKMRVRLREVAASLLHDTGLTPQVAGLRAEADRGTRQLVFASDVADLDLEVSLLDDRYAVTGQLGMDVVPENLSIRFVPADQDPLDLDVVGVVESVISKQGYFTLSIDPGDWTAAVEIEDAVVLFPGVHL